MIKYDEPFMYYEHTTFHYPIISGYRCIIVTAVLSSLYIVLSCTEKDIFFCSVCVFLQYSFFIPLVKQWILYYKERRGQEYTRIKEKTEVCNTCFVHFEMLECFTYV